MIDNKCPWFSNKIKKISKKLCLPDKNKTSYDHNYKFNDDSKSVKFESYSNKENIKNINIKYKIPKNKLEQQNKKYTTKRTMIKDDKKLTDDEKKKKLFGIQKSHDKYLKTCDKVIKSKKIKFYFIRYKKR